MKVPSRDSSRSHYSLTILQSRSHHLSWYQLRTLGCFLQLQRQSLKVVVKA